MLIVADDEGTCTPAPHPEGVWSRDYATNWKAIKLAFGAMRLPASFVSRDQE